MSRDKKKQAFLNFRNYFSCYVFILSLFFSQQTALRIQISEETKQTLASSADTNEEFMIESRGFTEVKVRMIIPVTERSEDTGLVYPLSVAWWAENYKFSTKGCFYFEEQRAIA